MDDRPIRVLYIDDDEDDYIVACDLLEEIEGKQITVEWVNNYEDALKAIEANTYDVHLVDYYLGGYTGLELISALKDKSKERRI